MRYRFPFIITVLTVVMFFSQCDKDADLVIRLINFPEEKGFDLLSEYNFFIGDLANLEPNTAAGVLPYDLNMALFSDYASKKRFIYVPEGKTIPYETTGVLDLPLGSILIKHFYYTEAGSEEQYLETRLLLKKEGGWQPETYVWNTEKTDAIRSVVGDTRVLSVAINGQNQTFNYLIPNQNQCKNCHGQDGAIQPIGPMLQNLDKSYSYVDGATNQIDKWVSTGILENPNTAMLNTWPKMDDLDASLSDRARAYLHVNCASCHSLEGAAANSGLYLSYYNQDSLSLGFYKTPVAAGEGSGGLTYAISPGEADQSILLYRMQSDEVEIRMPEIGRDIVHEEGVELIREWINSL